jgi:glycosyltransferase involved in cell wall biosynthesis
MERSGPGRPWRVLHLSHTDVRRDGRISRQVCSLLASENRLKIVAMGPSSSDGSAPARFPRGIEYRVLPLVARELRFGGRRFRHAVTAIEMTSRMIASGVRLRADLVHCHDVQALPAGWMIAVLTRAQLVYDAHELESHRNGMTRRASRLFLLVERWCWARISLLVSVSPSILEWYRCNLGPKRSVLVLNSPVVPAVSSDGPARRRRSFGETGYFHRRFGVPGGVPMFIYLGLLTRGRGIESVLDVFRRPDIRSHVVFMGYGDTIGVGDHAVRFPNIHVHPAVPHDQVVRFTREADCGLCLIEDVSLSDRLCLPNKLFEYAFAGVPVLASRLPEIARVVGEHGLGVCCDNDPEGIAAAVRRIEREGIESPRADLAELSWETQARRLQEAYRELLGGRGAASSSAKGGR